ncbi:hypothetical protein DS838_002229 [Geotrichum bryndzae]|nr:hypothetical protein DS838_002229 [Geotrichum bryndzae]
MQMNETEVLWQDQERINTFSKLNTRLTRFREELEQQQKEHEYLTDVQMELELVDEDEKVQYRIGGSFVFLPQPEALERLEADTEAATLAIEKKEAEIEEITSQMGALKKELYAKFGNAINLESD